MFQTQPKKKAQFQYFFFLRLIGNEKSIGVGKRQKSKMKIKL